MKIALLAPHMFMQEDLMNDVIFSPGFLAIELANGLAKNGNEVSLFTPSKVKVSTKVKNITGDFSLIAKELLNRGYKLNELMHKHPLTYITLARQIQTELIAKAYKMTNDGKFDIVHVYMNEEDIALNFAKLCNKPVVFTHHEPLNFLTKYRTSFEKFKNLNWISISMAQRKTVTFTPPSSTPLPPLKGSKFNWVGNVYHGIKIRNSKSEIRNLKIEGDSYFVYLGRIIEPKGVHLAIKAVKEFNRKRHVDVSPSTNYKLKIAGKHYSSVHDKYWEQKIAPFIDNKEIDYLGFINDEKAKNKLLANAKALLIPSTWDEPFGMVMLEALAVGTPIVGLDNGAIPEVIQNKFNGILVKTERNGNLVNEQKTIKNLVEALQEVNKIKAVDCLKSIEKFSIENMVKGYEKIYRKLMLDSH